VADIRHRLGIPKAQAVATARQAQVVTVGSLVDLDRVIRRGLAPSLPPGSQVRLTLLPDDQPERIRWERSLSRYATACGCHVASVAFLIMMAALVAASVIGGTTVAVPNLPVPVSWALFGISSALLVKLIALFTAGRALNRLRSAIETAAGTASRA